MRIRGFHIDGFGIFHDVRVDPLSPGVTVFLGHNEAGKSTTLDFFRAMLFGFPRKNSVARRQHEPLRGGRHGGQLSLLDGTRELVLQRGPGPRGGSVTLLDPSGSPLPEAELARLLGNVTEAFFCNVCAFSLDELQLLGKDRDEILGQLYGAATGAGNALTRAEGVFGKRLRDRFSPGGQNPLINQLLKRFEELDERINRAREDAGEYGQLTEREGELAQLLADQDKACHLLDRRCRELRALRDHRPDWQEIVEAERLLAALPEFPADTPRDAKALDEAEQVLRDASQKRADLAEELAEVKASIALVSLDEALHAHRDDVRALNNQLAGYRTARQRLPILTAEKTAAEQALAECLQQLGPDWTGDRVTACDRSLAVREQLQEHAIRLAATAQSVREADGQAQTAEREAQQARKRLSEAETNEAAARRAVAEGPCDVLQALACERDELVYLAQGLPDLSRQHRDLLAEVRTTAQQVDPAWGLEQVGAFDASLPAQNRLRELARAVDVADRAVEQASQDLQRAEAEVRTAEPQDGGEGMPSTQDGLAQARNRCRELQAALLRREAQAGQTPAGRNSVWWPALGAAALVFAVLGSAVTPFFLLGLLVVGALAYGLWASGAATVSVADAEGQIRACCAALGLDQQQVDAAAVDRLLEELAGGFRQVQLWQEAQARCRRAQAAKDSAEATAQETRTKWQGLVGDSGFSAEPSPETVLSLLPTIAGVQQKLADAERLAAEIGKRESRLDVAWGKLLATGLLPDAPTTFSVEALDRVLARQAAAAEALASASRRTKELGKEVQTRDEEAREALAALAARRKELATAEQEWRDWLAARGFQDTLTPATARDALDTVRDAWKHMQTLAALAEEQRRHERIIEEVNRAVGDLLKVLERQKGTQDIDTVIEALVEESAANDEKHVEAREKANRAVELEKKLERATEHEADCEKRLDEYLRAHGAESVEALREAISGAVRRQELQETCDRIFRALRSVLGTPDNDCVRTVFTSANYDVLADDLADREADLHEHETQREQARNERAEVRERLARLASSDDIARLRQEQESVRAEMDALAIEWARAALANRLLQEAKQTFEQERQPQVLREASTFFRLLTNDRYQGVFSPLGGERELRALLPDHDYRTPEQLSRGTVEQLYLALRFGFLADSADKGTALPVIMDEILVNFDPTRGKAAANAIGQLADTHQILYFTCHPSTAELLQEHANASLVHVRDGEFQPA